MQWYRFYIRSMVVIACALWAIVAILVFDAPSPRHETMRPLVVKTRDDHVSPPPATTPPAAVPTIKPDYSLPPVSDGLVPVLLQVPTTQKVVFLGIDDGETRSAAAQKILTAAHTKASLFLNDMYVRQDPAYFQHLQSADVVIENHTINHPNLTKLSYAQQKAEICGNADDTERVFGVRPTLLRPPYGVYNDVTRRAAADCDMKALIMWHAKANGGSMQYQDGNTGLLPGDIVLMHFRPEFNEDYKAFTDAATAAGLQVELLEDWLR